jgi:hypothetical protein
MSRGEGLSSAAMSEIRDELQASLAAREEVGRDLEPHLVEQFVDRIEDEIDRRIDAKLARPRQRQGSGTLPIALPLGSLGLAIPLLASPAAPRAFPACLRSRSRSRS